jgi:hypothetical protein
MEEIKIGLIKKGLKIYQEFIKILNIRYSGTVVIWFVCTKTWWIMPLINKSNEKTNKTVSMLIHVWYVSNMKFTLSIILYFQFIWNFLFSAVKACFSKFGMYFSIPLTILLRFGDYILAIQRIELCFFHSNYFLGVLGLFWIKLKILFENSDKY